MLSEGSAIIIEYKDDATAFNGVKKASISNKGVLNNKISEIIFDLLMEKGVPTHFIKRLNDREQLCKKVTMLVRRDEFRASKIMEARVRNTENIEILMNTETVEVLGDDYGVTGARVRNNKTGEEMNLDVTGFFVAIGHKPNTDIFKGWLDMDDVGYLKVTAGTSLTNVKGVFASGDAADKVYRQAVTAAGTGCMAALDAERYLTEIGKHDEN